MFAVTLRLARETGHLAIDQCTDTRCEFQPERCGHKPWEPAWDVRPDSCENDSTLCDMRSGSLDRHEESLNRIDPESLTLETTTETLHLVRTRPISTDSVWTSESTRDRFGPAAEYGKSARRDRVIHSAIQAALLTTQPLLAVSAERSA